MPTLAIESEVELSIVVPIFNEEETISTLVDRLSKTAVNIDYSSEVLFVNDGSYDSSRSMLEHFASKDSRVTVVNLSRNFGHQQAISAGLTIAKGNLVCVMDGDLQDPPEFIDKMLGKLKEGFDVVYAVRRSRQEGVFKRFAYSLFYGLITKLSNIDLPGDAGDFCVMRRCVVDSINSMDEYNRYVRGIRAYAGFRQTGMAYDRPARGGGEPKYGLRSLSKLALDGIISFSDVPLKLATIVGVIIALFSIAYGAYIVIWRLFLGGELPGFATLAVAIFLVGGIQLIFLGIVGEYISRIYSEIKHRPGFIIESIYRSKS